MSYVAMNSLDVRHSECARLAARYPGMLPIAAEQTGSKAGKPHFLALPCDATVQDLAACLCTMTGASARKPLGLAIDNCVLAPTMLIGDLFDKHEQDDGFLHVNFATEKVMGISFYVGIPCIAGVGVDFGNLSNLFN